PYNSPSQSKAAPGRRTPKACVRRPISHEMEPMPVRILKDPPIPGHLDALGAQRFHRLRLLTLRQPERDVMGAADRLALGREEEVEHLAAGSEENVPIVPARYLHLQNVRIPGHRSL